MKVSFSSAASLALLLVAARAEAQYGQPQYGQPQYGQPQYGQPQYGQPQYPPPQYAQPPYPQPQYGQPGVQQTVQQLDQSRRDDAHRKLEWVWIDVSGGFEQLGMTTFGGDRDLTAGFVPTSSSGGMISLGAGARLLYFTLLVRGRIGFFNSEKLYRIGLEGGFHVPLGRVEPHVTLGLGYAAAGGVSDDVNGAVASRIGLTGFYARFGAGLDYFVVPAVSLGLDLSADLLELKRAALSSGDVAAIKTAAPGRASSADTLANSATGWGGTIGVTGVVGLHF